MLHTCFGIYVVFALFTFLLFWGTIVKTHPQDEENEGI